MKKKPIAIRLDADLLKKVDDLAKTIYKDRTEIITEAIVKYLLNLKKKK